MLGHETDVSVAEVEPPGLADARTPQLLPFQCSANVLVAVFVVYTPTAKQLLALGHATPRRLVEELPLGFGLAWMLQLLPFQCSASGLMVNDVEKLPTAKQLFVLGHDTPVSPAPAEPPGVAPPCTPQALPFQCSTRGSCVEPAA